MEDIHRLMDETSRHYEQRMAGLHQTIEALRNRCVNLQKENKKLQKDKAALIREKKKRQHFKNGKRGTKWNG